MLGFVSRAEMKGRGCWERARTFLNVCALIEAESR